MLTCAILFVGLWTIACPVVLLLAWLSGFWPRSYFEFTRPEDIRPGYYYTGGWSISSQNGATP